MLCGYGRIGGFAVGIVANQKLHAHQTDHEEPQADGIRRRDLHGIGGKSRTLHYGLQSELDSSGLFS